MAYLEVENATKVYGGAARALDGVSLSVGRDEFFTLLGPSGCGKTTLLRSIAGFIELSDGNIKLDGRRLDTVPAHKRDIGMVFQDYAVFPHLTVSENVAFGLKARKVPAADIQRRVAEALATARLTDFRDRLPAAMSGGQQQRIGLARAMVIRPKLLLMDEPLSNLDAKLRVDLRDEIRDIQKKIGIAAIYVTHDQEEALAISDRICVMSTGRIQQIGTPQDIYSSPQTLFAASFVGTMNVLQRGTDPALEASILQDAPASLSQWAIRPEHIRLGEGDLPADTIRVPGTVEKYTYLGREAHIAAKTSVGKLVVQVADPEPSLTMEQGHPVTLAFRRGHVMGFDQQGARVSLGAR
ncbi:ABC transporter ATP-binding protein [Microvirga pudoricolor]|uniref:ABC transporter ATP-binding protein n=1 Tax=Microvirga pudoricolor TaxID=2778729 RepID=UPI001950D1E4|nr:ABC transporter ATP-binding protein [Microvirga pudoricolor]MBM6592503.1 ABC transporter ATP-binding protein [Microvirga pudoricolor]